jgi:predicted PolB exonuclease-like 3'-5' exonuclease
MSILTGVNLSEENISFINSLMIKHIVSGGNLYKDNILVLPENVLHPSLIKFGGLFLGDNIELPIDSSIDDLLFFLYIKSQSKKHVVLKKYISNYIKSNIHDILEICKVVLSDTRIRSYLRTQLSEYVLLELNLCQKLSSSDFDKIERICKKSISFPYYMLFLSNEHPDRFNDVKFLNANLAKLSGLVGWEGKPSKFYWRSSDNIQVKHFNTDDIFKNMNKKTIVFLSSYIESKNMATYNKKRISIYLKNLMNSV